MFGTEEGAPADPHQAAARRKQLVFELNKNGQYLRLKEQLKAAVIGIVKDSYHKSGGMGREEMQASLCLASQPVQLSTCSGDHLLEHVMSQHMHSADREPDY